MDMNSLNSRQKQEDGIFMPVCDQYTGEPINPGPEAPGFMVRGVAARSVQMKLAEAQQAAKQAAKAKKDGKTDDDIISAMLERAHEGHIDAAMKYIIEARNMTIGEEPVTTPEQIRAVLDMNFPDMQIEKDEDGKPMMTAVKGDDGKTVMVPKFEIINKTWAMQVIAAAEDQRAFLGKRPNG